MPSSTPDSSPVSIARRGLLRGIAWGFAIGVVHLVVGVGLILALNVPPMTWFVAKSIVFELMLAIPLGLLFSPLLALPRGAWLHTGALALAWLVMERWVAVDPTKLQMWVAPTLVGLLIFGVAMAIIRRYPATGLRTVAAVALLLPVVILSLPVIRYRMAGYDSAKSVDRGTPPANAPDVLFIVMDTVRAKSVSAYGYERQTTPVFDALAKDGLLFENANSAATWSLPAHASLFTGHFPSSHQAHDETRYLDDKLPTLAQTMSTHGWETRCFTANPYINETFGLVRGFEWSDQAWISGAGGRGFSFVYRFVDAIGFQAQDKGGGQVVANLERWMADRPKDGPPAFVFVNFLEAHFPFNQLPREHLFAYTDAPMSRLRGASQTAFGVQFGRQLTPAEQEEIRQPILDMYDGGVRYTDELVGRVIDLWRKRGTLDDTVVVILGDHGEMVGEHGAFGHVSSMYQPDLHVPLLVRYPPKLPTGQRISTPVSTVGLFATVMELTNQSPPEGFVTQVGSLVPPAVPPEGPSTYGEPIIAERYEEEMLANRFAEGTANGNGPLLLPHGRYRSLRKGDLKLVHYTLGGGPWLFDLAADPNEDTNLAASRPDDLLRMEEELELIEDTKLRPLDAPIGDFQRKALSDAECAQLAALGYVDESCD